MLLLLGFFSIPLLIVATPMILLVIFGLALPKVKRLNRQWERLALSLGMRFVPGSLSRAPSMNGLIDGIPVRVTVIQSKGRRNHTRRTQVAARPDVDFPEAFRLAGESLLSTIDQALGVRDIKTGHQPFDQRMMITGKDPGTVRRFLTADMREVLDEFIVYGRWVDQRSGCVVTQAGAVEKPELLRTMIADAVAGAQALNAVSRQKAAAAG